MRRWHYHAVTNQPHSIIVTPSLVQIVAGDADNFITNIHIGRTFNMEGAVPRLGADVPRWYGETIGFWDNDVLITWTSNIQGWKVHGNPEFSNKLQTDRDLHAEPRRGGEVRRPQPRGHLLRPRGARRADPDGPPPRAERAASRTATRTPSSSACRRFTRSTAARHRWLQAPCIQYKVPDMFGRPWAESGRNTTSKG